MGLIRQSEEGASRAWNDIGRSSHRGRITAIPSLGNTTKNTYLVYAKVGRRVGRGGGAGEAPKTKPVGGGGGERVSPDGYNIAYLIPVWSTGIS